MTEPVIVPFRPLGKYDWPSTPVDHGIDRVRTALLERLRGRREQSAVDMETLVSVEPSLLDRLAPPPASHPLMAELDLTLQDWAASSNAVQPLQMVVLPPCERDDILSVWARQNDLELFSADRDPAELEGLNDPDQPPLIIPRLEDRFLRTPQGLSAVRELIRGLAGFRRRALIGCNSWAWQFLRKSCEIDLVLSEPITFRAFNRHRLRNWLGRLALGTLPDDVSDERAERLCFRAVDSGADVFGNGDGDDEISAYMTDLARRSFGIPWVAWHLWRDGLHLARPADTDDATDASDAAPKEDPSNPETIWVTRPRSVSLPDRSDQNALLVLHALLIHGGLTQANIDRTVPLISYTNVLSSLLRDGLIDETDGLYRCIPAAYPTIRDGLRNNGYPLDVL
ncbi:hypothetical protein ACFFUB_09680 [Algimonas porphyrae]|uniref:Uncharacterized protein n=1 Tax=Algimonas porphyrae TaxID=1128113 RepID=A0ABQ5V2C5_9PROT|nr:hypothetical protein [Algimonas porphyrae]GLQ21613.1 hypothetical protein GCM10007854_25680 [Algimonas porphyrae]